MNASIRGQQHGVATRVAADKAAHAIAEGAKTTVTYAGDVAKASASYLGSFFAAFTAPKPQPKAKAGARRPATKVAARRTK